GLGLELLRQRDQSVGFSTHCRNYDNELMSRRLETGDPGGDVLDPLGRADRGTAVFLYDQRHRRSAKSVEFYRNFFDAATPFATPRPGAHAPDAVPLSLARNLLTFGLRRPPPSRGGREAYEINGDHEPAGDTSAPGTQSTGVLDQDRRHPERRFTLRKRTQHAQARSRAAAPGSCRARRPHPRSQRGF